MFEFLGLTGEMNKLAVFPQGLEMRDSITGKTFVELPVDHRFFDKYHAPYAVIHRADMLDVIYRACKKSNLITLTTSQKVIGFDETAGGVSARTESGQTFTGAALVGCDGLWSTIRQILVGDGKPVVSGHIAYRAVVPTEEWPKEYRINKMILWGGEKTHLVHYPLRRGELFNLVAVFHSDRYEEGWDTYGDPDELHARFAEKCEPVRTLLQEGQRLEDVGAVRPPGDQAMDQGQDHAAGRRRAPDAAVPRARAPTWRWRTRCASPSRSWRTATTTPRRSRNIRTLRYLRTARVQLMARVFGEIYHASGVNRELRNQVLGDWTAQRRRRHGMALRASAWPAARRDRRGAEADAAVLMRNSRSPEETPPWPRSPS